MGIADENFSAFLCTCHEMAERHIEFYLSMCVCFQNLVRLITLSCMVGFENNFMTRGCLPCKNHIARSKIKVTVCSCTLCIGFSEICFCLAQNFVLHGGT